MGIVTQILVTALFDLSNYLQSHFEQLGKAIETKLKKAAESIRGFSNSTKQNLALTCLKTTLCFVDHVNAALTTNHATVPVARLERAERVFDLHGLLLFRGARGCACLFQSYPTREGWWA